MPLAQCAPQSLLVSNKTDWVAPQQPYRQRNNHPIQNNNGDTNQPFDSRLLTSSEQDSICVLRDLDDQLIFASLDKLRAVEAGSQLWDQQGLLSSQQTNAILTLIAYSNDRIFAWLSSARCNDINKPRQYSAGAVPDAQYTSIPSALEASPNSSIAPSRSSSGLHEQAFSYNDYTLVSPTTSRTSLDQRSIFFGTSSGNSTTNRSDSSISAKYHLHGCAVCPKKHIDTCDGWKRHMKEHETKFPCTRCRDGNGSGSSQSYTRKQNLVKHLVKVHQLTETDADALAEGWRITRHKKFFSCGFCVTLFNTIIDQLNHIDNEHFKRNQRIRDWEFSKVIRGLLHQPRLASAMRGVTGSAPDALEHLSWPRSDVDGLQLRLELSTEPPATLISAAIKQSTSIPQRLYNNEKRPAMNMSIQQTSILGSMPGSRRQNQLTSRPTSSQFGLDQTIATHGSQDQHCPARDWFPSDDFDLGVPFTQSDGYPDHDIYMQGSDLAQYPDSEDVSRANPQQDEQCGWIPLQKNTSPSTYTPTAQNTLNRDDRISYFQQSSTDLDCIVPTNATPQMHANFPGLPGSPTQITYPTGEDFDEMSLADSSTVPSPSCPEEIFNEYPSHRKPKRQPRESKLQSHYGVPPGPDFDSWQGAMLDDERTRSEPKGKRQQ